MIRSAHKLCLINRFDRVRAPGCGLQHCDMEMAKFLITTISKYFPTGLAFALAVDFPWILKTFWNVIKTLIPANRRSLLTFTTKEDAQNFINVECLPQARPK